MESVTERELNFKDFEQWCYDMGMVFARMLMVLALTGLDDHRYIRLMVMKRTYHYMNCSFNMTEYHEHASSIVLDPAVLAHGKDAK